MKEISQLTFDTKYKFQVSLGTLFIILPFILIGYIFSISKNEILFTNEQYNNFTMESQSIVSKLQQNYEIAFCVLLILLIPSVLVGGYLIRNGLKDWKKFEDLDYTKKALQVSEVNKQITKASPEEIRENLKSDLKLEEHTEVIDKKDLKIYQSIEDSIVRRIYETAPANYKVVSNSILNRFLYDVIAMGQGKFDKDIIFEIKYLQKNIDITVLNSYIRKIHELSSNYSIETNRLPYKKLILVTSDEFVDETRSLTRPQKINNLSIVVLKENEIKKTNFFN